MIRTLTDLQRGELVGQPVPIKAGIDVAEVKRDHFGPSGTLLAYYRQYFKSNIEFMDFMRDIVIKPTGTALDGRLSWET